jgi:2-haloacid dehalogenase
MTSEIRVLTFDVFGTVVDWRGGVAREAERILGAKGYALDWGGFADAWRARYQPAMARVSRGQRPFVVLDVLHMENLEQVLEEKGVTGLTPSEIDDLNRAWHRLDPWPDVLDAFARLRPKFILAALSNGNLALIVAMARRARLGWDASLGGDVARAYKPAPESYDNAARLLGLQPSECLMVAAHPSDLQAAAARGFRTAYVHRPLEYGPGRAAQRPATGAFDYAVDNLVELAERLGA